VSRPVTRSVLVVVDLRNVLIVPFANVTSTNAKKMVVVNPSVPLALLVPRLVMFVTVNVVHLNVLSVPSVSAMLVTTVPILNAVVVLVAGLALVPRLLNIDSL